MGRAETDELSAAQIFYPCMQCADIFFLRADICQLGMDQRKVRCRGGQALHSARAPRGLPAGPHQLPRGRVGCCTCAGLRPCSGSNRRWLCC